MTMFVKVDGVQLHVNCIGDGEPILFVHGFPLSGEMWTPVIERLGSGWRCIVPDLRGHGQSDATAEASMTRYADDLAAVLDGVNEKRPVVFVGLSMGGIVGFEFFRRHRARVRALALCDTRYNAESPEGKVKREAVARSVLERGSTAAAEGMIDNLFAPGVDPALRARWMDIMSRTPAMGTAAAARALGDRPDSTDTLARIDCPTLIIYGEKDAITPPEIGREIHKGVRGSRFEIIPGAGHMPPVEKPEEFSRLLHDFLRSLKA